MKNKPGKKVRLWIFQTDHSGNTNGHFEMLELPVKSTKEDVFKAVHWWCIKCFNIRNLGVVTSKIPDKDFCPKNIGTKLPKKYQS
jgi:hypothetical protein